jgi:hypothetical protein
VRELVGGLRPQRLDPAVRRLLRWWSVRWVIRVVGAVLAVVLVGQLVASWGARERRPIEAGAPSAEAVDLAIERASGYLDGLYREIPDGRAVVSEYYGLPLLVFFRSQVRWIRPGDPELTITAGEQSRLRESYMFRYAVPGLDVPIALLVVVRWDPATGAATIEVTQVDGDADEPVVVYLGRRSMGEWRSSTTERKLTARVPRSGYGELRSLRYTVRHVAMLSAATYAYRGDAARAARLDRLVSSSGYDAGADVYAPLWHHGLAQADDFVFAPSVYRDCADPAVREAMPEAPLYYPYQSKVCAIPTWGYVAMSREDPLVPLAQGLHILDRYADPLREYSDGEHLNSTVVDLAADMEHRFRAAGGIAECLPGSCDTGSTSTLRTVLFGLLETALGFDRGDETSRTYADAVAEALLDQQVGPDGLIPTTTRGELYRPDQAGGFFTHVAADGRSGEPDSFTRQQMSRLADVLDIRPEYVGEIATNAETTLAAYAFLVRYRCARFGTGCQGLLAR